MKHQNEIMKLIYQIFFYCIFASSMISCGTLGHIQFYNFNASKDAVEENLLAVINKDARYTPPSKWNGYESGADSTRDIFIMFQSIPMEVYQVDFAFKESWSNSASCKLALVCVFDGNLWHFEDDLSSKEENRVMKRFESEILSKMKYQYSKE